MKTLTLSAPDEIFDQTVDALCFTGGYGGDTEGKLAFAKEQLITILGDVTRQHAQQQIRQSAQQQIQASIEAAHAAIAVTYDFIAVDVITE